MSSSKALHGKADRLVELAVVLQEIREILFEEARQVRFNADLQWRSEQRKRGEG